MFFKGPNFKNLEFPPDLDEETKKLLIKRETLVFKFKFMIAIIVLIAGIYFIYKGIISTSSIKLSLNNFKLEINNAWPGIVLCFISLILMLFPGSDIKVKKK